VETPVSKKNRRRTREQEEPVWQPISGLPLFAAHIDGHVAHLVDQLDLLEKARAQPYVLDDATVQRITKVHKETLDTIVLYAQQLDRWRAEPLTRAQRQEVDRLTDQLGRLRALTRETLDVADELARGTIERVLAMSDEEVGRAVLEGRFGPAEGGVSQPRAPSGKTVDITSEVFARIRARLTPEEEHRLATASVPHSDEIMLLFLSRMMPAAVEEAVTRTAAGAGRGVILADQTGSDWAFRWVSQAGCDKALSTAPPETRREVADVVEVYDTETEAAVVLLTRTSLRLMLAGVDGTYRSPGSRPVGPRAPSRPRKGSAGSGTDGSSRQGRDLPSGLVRAAEYIDSNVDVLQDSLSMYRIAVGKPHAIGDATLRRSLERNRRLLLDADAPEAQLAKWLGEPLTPAQRTEVRRLLGQMECWRERCQEIIDTLNELLGQNAANPKDRLMSAAFLIELCCRPYASLSPTGRRALPFVLPPEVAVSQVATGPDARIYRFEHAELGLLGELSLTRSPGAIDADAWANDRPGTGTAEVRRRRRKIFIDLTSRIKQQGRAEE